MKPSEKLVWYASYGSNMLYERFLCYIKGGTFAVNGGKYDGCTDKTPPRKNKACIIPYEMYFGNESKSWGGHGVSFLDVDTRGDSLGRMYLITDDQLRQVHCQEGAGPNWYDKIVYLGEDSGFPVKTFTNSGRRSENAPCSDYLEVILEGMREMLLSSNGIDAAGYYEKFRAKYFAKLQG